MYIGSREYFLERILHTDASSLKDVLSDVGDSYHIFQIPKKGGAREIRAIERGSDLYELQKALCQNFLEKVPLPIPAVGFVKEESYLTFLRPHVGKTHYLRLDIQGFFDSITTGMLKKCFGEFFSEDVPENLTDFLALCTCEGCLPQGAVTSPAISNIVFRRADQRILKYCQSFDALYQNGRKLAEDICYTRYADDMLFSSRYLDFSKAPYFIGMISGILKSMGFRLNKNKLKYGLDEISLSGFVVSENIHLSRKKLYSLNKLTYFLGKTTVCGAKKYRVKNAFFHEPDWLEQINRLGLPKGRGGVMHFAEPRDFLNYLCGYRSFLLSILKVNDTMDSDMKQLSKKVKKLELIIDCVLKSTESATV